MGAFKWGDELRDQNTMTGETQQRKKHIFFYLRRIEEELGDQARFAGHNFRNPSALWIL